MKKVTKKKTPRSSSKQEHRLKRNSESSIQNWKKPRTKFRSSIKKNSSVDCGWGKIIFAHTFESNEAIAKTLCEEKKGTRNIGFYLVDPHVVLSLAPQELFLDPSHTYRIRFEHYRPSKIRPNGFHIRRAESLEDIEFANSVYLKRGMVPFRKDFGEEQWKSKKITILIAEDSTNKKTIGVVLGVDHHASFDDPELGTSLWSLAVDPDTILSGVGEELVRSLIEHYQARSRAYLDLSVLHDNEQAISLYNKLGFKRVPVFCVKHKNAINEPLYIAPRDDSGFNPYCRIITDEARRRGINVRPIDATKGYFELSFAGRSIVCRESLTELCPATSMSICENKSLTLKIVKSHKIHVPAQIISGKKKDDETFLKQYKRIVVKPSSGEQGRGVSVDIRSPKDLHFAVEQARNIDSNVILEEFVSGQDLRVVVIDHQVVAASLRIPPVIQGTGRHSVQQLIQKLSRRRSAATGGESKIPLDEETIRTLKHAGVSLDTVPKKTESIQVRKTANLHTGGQLIDVTNELHPSLVEVAEEVSKILRIPVVGLDFLVKDHREPEYVLIEANERPGLANHEPQPTAQRFIDHLFPQTKIIYSETWSQNAKN